MPIMGFILVGFESREQNNGGCKRDSSSYLDP